MMDKMRDEFEAEQARGWAPMKPFLDRDGEGYADKETNGDWRVWQSAWQAARQPQERGEAVKRYTATGDYAYPVSESADGEFVDYDDYATLTAELAAMQEQRDSLRDECERLREEDEYKDLQYHLLASEMVYKGNSVQHWAQKGRAYKAALGRAWEELEKAGIRPDGTTPVADAIKKLAALSASGREEKSNGR